MAFVVIFKMSIKIKFGGEWVNQQPTNFDRNKDSKKNGLYLSVKGDTEVVSVSIWMSSENHNPVLIV